MRDKVQQCIRLSDWERKAQEQDMEHYKHRLFHTPGAGELGNGCAYDFNRGWEYAIGRIRDSVVCISCPDAELCEERNYRV